MKFTPVIIGLIELTFQNTEGLPVKTLLLLCVFACPVFAESTVGQIGISLTIVPTCAVVDTQVSCTDTSAKTETNNSLVTVSW
jgi:hypothetical protein